MGSTAASDTTARAAQRDQLRRTLGRLAVERDRSGETTRAAAPMPAVPRTDDAPGRRLAVLDVSDAWSNVAVEGCEVVVVAPGGDLVGRLAEIGASWLLGNLAAPGVLAALAALRTAACPTRVWGCLGDPVRGRTLPLGPIELAARPLDADAVAELLAPLATRGTRVVTIGADIDALVSVRYALTHQGMSVSMAWDARQAADILPLVRPDVVVLDLALPAREGYTILARLSGSDPAPTVVLVPAEEDASSALAAALAEPANVQRAVPPARLLARIRGQR